MHIALKQVVADFVSDRSAQDDAQFVLTYRRQIDERKFRPLLDDAKGCRNGGEGNRAAVLETQEFSDRPLVVLGRDLTSRHNDTKRTVLVRAVVPNPVKLDAGVSPNGFSFVDERALARGGEFVRCGEADLEDSRGLDVRFAGRVGDSPA